VFAGDNRPQDVLLWRGAREAFVDPRQSAMTRSSPQDAAAALRRTPDVARGA
jgi:hypothetical protein